MSCAAFSKGRGKKQGQGCSREHQWNYRQPLVKSEDQGCSKTSCLFSRVLPPDPLGHTLLYLQTALFSLIFSSTKDSEDLKLKLFLFAMDWPTTQERGNCKCVYFLKEVICFLSVLVQVTFLLKLHGLEIDLLKTRAASRMLQSLEQLWRMELIHEFWGGKRAERKSAREPEEGAKQRSKIK